MNKTGRKLFSLELPHPRLLSQLSSRRHQHQHRPHSILGKRKKKLPFFLGLCPKLWVGGGQKS